MQAKSLLGSARAIDRRLEDLLSARLLADDPAAWTHAAAIRETLADVAEQLRASVPLPAANDESASTEEQAFVNLLGVLAEVADPTPEQVREMVEESKESGESGRETGKEGDQPLDRLQAADRVEIRESTLVVPLGQDPAGRNWWAVLEYLRESVADLAGKASKVHSRLTVASADDLLVTVWDTVTERLDVLGAVLAEMTANGRYAGRHATADEGPTEFVAWTADQFTSSR